jgi:hypothetical protein
MQEIAYIYLLDILRVWNGIVVVSGLAVCYEQVRELMESRVSPRHI